MNSLTQKLTKILKLNLSNKFTSVSYAIMKDGNMLAADTIGTNGSNKNNNSTINDTYNVASVSKIFCSLAAMKLVELGKLDLDKPIYKYLPKFKMLDERYKKITTRHCLSHSSGLPGTQWKGFSVTDVTEDNYYETVYDYMAKNYLKAEPGEYSVYCNDGFTMAEIVISEISGMRYSKFVEKYITKPIDAKTTQTSDLLTGENTLTKEKKKPYELLYIQGAAGFTTSMTDLCKLGDLILNPNGILKKESIDEMAKPHGITFLDADTSTCGYGLGWDNVNLNDMDYDLGEGVMQKGGNSFQFTTQFIVIPKYNAVLAISETHDCEIDVLETILRLFATAMLEEGINIYKKHSPIPKDIIKKYEGTYLVPSGIYNVQMYGAIMNITHDTTRGKSTGVFKNLKYNGKTFEGLKNQELYFTEFNDEAYLMVNYREKNIPLAQKAKPKKPITKKWENRISKQYVCITTTPYDLVTHEIMTGFKIEKLKDIEGILIASFVGREDADIYGVFESSFIPMDDNTGTGFINTPCNGSRDFVTLCFKSIEGIEYCDASSYTYIDVESLPKYEGQGFHQNKKTNKVYKIQNELTTLPQIPNGRRILVLKNDLSVDYDSLYENEYRPVNDGFISFI
ncbi:serine hydrolase [Sedimentibacter sp. zth1]|uniref:serine hydrolase domain-containing protein n=1 Tax=Sedimentibacter sp. zth1 TaxID=2816908 RepID=UPI001A911135|nr:serine hydrolase [Sedimentibacter sp. zth1]QSX06568.1 serine hydrolase [Sedimentibacter sp. zth1]